MQSRAEQRESRARRLPQPAGTVLVVDDDLRATRPATSKRSGGTELACLPAAVSGLSMAAATVTATTTEAVSATATGATTESTASAAEATECAATAAEAAAGAAESGRNPSRRGGHRWPLGRLDASHRTRVAALHSWVAHVWVPRVWPGARRRHSRKCLAVGSSARWSEAVAHAHPLRVDHPLSVHTGSCSELAGELTVGIRYAKAVGRVLCPETRPREIAPTRPGTESKMVEEDGVDDDARAEPVGSPTPAPPSAPAPRAKG